MAASCSQLSEPRDSPSQASRLQLHLGSKYIPRVCQNRQGTPELFSHGAFAVPSSVPYVISLSSTFTLLPSWYNLSPAGHLILTQPMSYSLMTTTGLRTSILSKSDLPPSTVERSHLPSTRGRSSHELQSSLGSPPASQLGCVGCGRQSVSDAGEHAAQQRGPVAASGSRHPKVWGRVAW